MDTKYKYDTQGTDEDASSAADVTSSPGPSDNTKKGMLGLKYGHVLSHSQGKQ